MKTIFWNVDTQKDFMNKDGALYIEGAEAIKPNLARLTRIAEKYAIQTVNTGDWHHEDSEELSDNPDLATTFPPHCMAGTEGAEFIPETTPTYAGNAYWDSQAPTLVFGDGRNNKKKKPSSDTSIIEDIVIYKDNFDVFVGNPHTGIFLDELAPDRVIVYGVATNVCVKAAVEGLLDHTEVYVVTDAIHGLPAGGPLKSTEELLEQWKARGVRTTTTADLERLLR